MLKAEQRDAKPEEDEEEEEEEQQKEEEEEDEQEQEKEQEHEQEEKEEGRRRRRRRKRRGTGGRHHLREGVAVSPARWPHPTSGAVLSLLCRPHPIMVYIVFPLERRPRP